MKIKFNFDDEIGEAEYVRVSSQQEAEEIESNATDNCLISYVVEVQQGGDFKFLGSEIEMPASGIDETWNRPQLMDWDSRGHFQYFNEEAFNVRDFLMEFSDYDWVGVSAVIFRSQLDEDQFFGHA